MCDREVRWTVHLAKNEPAKTAVVLFAALFAGLLSILMLQSVWAFPVGLIVILVSSGDFLLPIKYEIGKKGATRRCGLSVSHIEWKAVKRVIEGEDGIKLSPLSESSRTAPFRGVFLRTPENREEILACISYWKENHAEAVGHTPER